MEIKQHIPAHGGKLVNLVVDSDSAEQLKEEAMGWPSITLNERQVNELELLMNGGFSPLEGYLGIKDYESVLTNMRLDDGTLWPMPVCLDVSPSIAEKLEVGQKVALRDPEGFMPAVLEISEIYEVDLEKEAEAIYDTTSLEHPGVRALLENHHTVCLAGKVQGVELPLHFDFEVIRDTPAELREKFHRMGWHNVVAFNTSEPMHRMERQVTLDVARDIQANILVHPLLGEDQPGDMNRFARVRGYREVVRKYPHQLGMLSLLSLSRRSAGPREALWHAIIRQNYGCSHLIVGAKYASPADSQDIGYYPLGSAQQLISKHQHELSIQMVAVEEQAYSPKNKRFMSLQQLEEKGDEALTISEAEVRDILSRGEKLPRWFTYPDVEKELAAVYPSHEKIGFTLFFTGLSGSGKSTLARMIHSRLIEEGGRPVTLLDGDVVRLNLSSELGFSKEHRNLNIRRIGFVANEISKNGGIAICAPIAPYTAVRRDVRELIEQHGTFIEIHVATPLEVCEARDRKGLYAKARKGIIPEFTGISDPYEEPMKPELRIDTSQGTPMEQAQRIMLYLFREGYLGITEDEM
jgi:sulfate adenylyltransferase